MSGKAPIEVKIGELSVRLSPLTLNDLSSFENWVKSERLRLAQESLGSISGADRAAIISAILSEPIDITKEIASVPGVCRLLWQSAAKNDNGLEFEAFADAVELGDMTVMGTLVDKLAMGDKEATDTGHPTESGSQVGGQSG